MKPLAVIAALLTVGGCSTTPVALEEKTAPTVRTYAENYQEIYRRTSGAAKRCFATSLGPYASMAVDADLFSELGYGEIKLSLINMGVRNYYISAKIEKEPKGSRMTVFSGNTVAPGAWEQKMLAWAAGQQDC